LKIKLKRIYLESLLDKAMTVKSGAGTDSRYRTFLLELVDDKLRVLRTDTILSVVAEMRGVKALKSDQTANWVLVSGEKFYELVKNLEAEEVTLTFTDDLSIVISAGSFEAEWMTYPLNDYERPPKLENVEMFELPSQAFVKAVGRVRHAIASEGVHQNLKHVFFSGDSCWAHDGFVYQRIDFKSPQQFSLPMDGLEVLNFIKLSGSETFKVGFTDKYTVFEVGADSFLCKMPHLKTPTLSLLEQLKESRQGSFVFEVAQLQGLIKRVSLSSDLGKRAIRINIEKESLSVSAVDMLGNKGHEEMLISFTGNQTAQKAFPIDWMFLEEALSSLHNKGAKMVIDVHHVILQSDDSFCVIPMMER
jgi:DNA polymerase III sliding clamp (beta) subunit (PCNA family)